MSSYGVAYLMGGGCILAPPDKYKRRILMRDDDAKVKVPYPMRNVGGGVHLPFLGGEPVCG